MVAQVLDFLLGGDVQHVNAFSSLARQVDQPLRRHQRRGLVAPHRVRARVALDAMPLAVVEAILVLGVKGGAAADHLEDAAQALVVLDQQRAGGGADEHLDAGGAGEPLEFRELVDIFPRGADKKGEVAIHPPAAACDLARQGFSAHRRGLGVRHLEDRRHAAEHGRQAARLQIFLVLEPGLAEMHLRVDHARQHVQASGIDGLGGLGRGQAADGGDPAVFNADIGEAFPGMVDEGGAFDEEIEALGQGFTFAGACKVRPA